MNTYKFGASLLVMGVIALPAAADGVYYDTARVLSVTPQLERFNSPLQECHTEYIQGSYNSGDRSLAGSIIGGITGGLLGSQIGKGKGRIASAAVGAATGAVVGDRIDNNGNSAYSSRPVEHCAVVDNWQTVNRGYQVVYRYNGRDYSTVMPNAPGDVIRVQIAVAPGVDSRGGFMEPAYRYENGRYRGWDNHRRDRDDRDD